MIDDDVTAPGGLGDERLPLADGVELLGRYQDSGFREVPYLLKRGDGQVVQVSELIYRVATYLASGYRLHQVAQRVSSDLGRTVSVENIAYLVNRKLRPTGLLRDPRALGANAGADAAGASTTAQVPAVPPPSPRADALPGPERRVPLVPAPLHAGVTRLLTPLFRPPAVAVGLAGLVAMDAWLLMSQRDDLATGVREIIHRPQLMLLLTALTLVAGAVHETGHATAARCGGATPGALGAGVHLVWPVFHSDVADSHRLSRRGRMRTDLGGVWFNVLFALGVAGVYLATGLRPLLVYLVLAQLETLRQFLPFVRLDGYYLASDLAGVPNLFGFTQPVLVSLLGRRPAARRAARARLDELTPRARRLITAWVAITVPVLLGNVVLLVVLLPRLAGAAWVSAGVQLQAIGGAGGFDPLTAANGLVGLVLLAVPVSGVLYLAARLVEKLCTAMAAGWRSRRAPAALVTGAVAVLAAWQVGFVWPDAFAASLDRVQQATVPAVARAGAPPGVAGPDHSDHIPPAALAPAAPATGTAPSTTAATAPTSSSVIEAVAQAASGTLPPEGFPVDPPYGPAPTGPAAPVGSHLGTRSGSGDRATSAPATAAATAPATVQPATAPTTARPTTTRPSTAPTTAAPAPPRAPSTTTTTSSPPNLLGGLLDAVFGGPGP